MEKPKPKLLTEKEFVESMSGLPRGWEDLICSGRRDPETLVPGKLKDAMNQWLESSSVIQKILDDLGFRAG